jgi:predicted metal-dependent hydrolase
VYSGDYLELASNSGEPIRVLRSSHPRARRLRLTVTSSGARITYPEGTHPSRVSAFLREHGEWLRRKLAELHLGTSRTPLKVGLTTLVSLRGESTRLVWRHGPYPRIERNGDRLVLWLPQTRSHAAALATAQGLLRSFLEAQLQRDVSRYLGRYCPELRAAPSAVRVRPLKSLWGSLDVRNRMNLDLALALAPPAALRYVAVHELCHLRVRSHAPRFWSLVESLYPEWREQRDWLRAHGQTIKAELARLIQPAES